MARIADDVGIIIPVYNRPRLVLQTLESVAKQGVLPGKLIIIDDGSTDNTARAVQQWIDNLQVPINAALISTENRGVSAARNRGLRFLDRCKFVAFLDSDDLWPESFVERMRQRLDQEPGAIAVTCDRLVLNLQTQEEQYFDLTKIEENPISWMLKYGAGILSCSMFRLQSLIDAGGFCEATQTGEDSELLLRIALKGTWLYESGEPITKTFRLHIDDEDGNKSRAYTDSNKRWAEINDSFIRGLDVDHPNRSEWKELVSRRWYRAGLFYQGKKLYADANLCYGRALFWERLRFRNLYRYLTSLFMRTIA